MAQEWFPNVESNLVVGKFADVEDIDGPASRAKGFNVYRQVCALHERITGHPDTSVRAVSPDNFEEFKALYPGAWEAYQGQPRAQAAGTPLSEMGLPQSRITLLELQGFSTVEQLAAVSDAQLQTMGIGSLAMRRAAGEFLAEKAKQDAAIVKEAAAEIVAKKRAAKKRQPAEAPAEGA